LLCSLAIAVLPLSRIQGDRQRAAIVIVKEVAPQNQRRLLMRQHCSLATVVEEDLRSLVITVSPPSRIQGE
jgi:hypothetical protein